MILWIRDELKSLPCRQLLVIVVTMILPLSFSLVVLFLPSHIVDHVLTKAILVVASLIWGLITAILIASARKGDSAEVKQAIEKKLGALSAEINDLEKRRVEAEAGLQAQIDDYAQDMREGFRRLGVPVHHRVRADPASWRFDVPQASVTLTRADLGRLKRFLRWVQRFGRTLRRWVWG